MMQIIESIYNLYLNIIYIYICIYICVWLNVLVYLGRCFAMFEPRCIFVCVQ